MGVKVCDREVNTSENHSLLELWHKRFGQVGDKSFLHLVKGKHLPNFKGMILKYCVYYLASKWHHVSFSNKVHKECA